MTNERSLRGLLHRATHRIPGIRAHADRPAGHQGAAVHGAAVNGVSPHLSLNRRWNHAPGRPPRFLPGWQRRIAALFGRGSR